MAIALDAPVPTRSTQRQKISDAFSIAGKPALPGFRQRRYLSSYRTKIILYVMFDICKLIAQKISISSEILGDFVCFQ